MEEGASGEAVAAQPMEDRLVEAAHGRELRVDVQRVAVTRQSVDGRLLRTGLVAHLVVGRPLGRHVPRAGRPTVAAEAALAAYEHRRARLEQGFARLGVDRGRLHDDNGTGALVVDTHDLAFALDLAFGRDRPR